jgi:hypothetical protein
MQERTPEMMVVAARSEVAIHQSLEPGKLVSSARTVLASLQDIVQRPVNAAAALHRPRRHSVNNE